MVAALFWPTVATAATGSTADPSPAPLLFIVTATRGGGASWLHMLPMAGLFGSACGVRWLLVEDAKRPSARMRAVVDEFSDAARGCAPESQTAARVLAQQHHPNASRHALNRGGMQRSVALREIYKQVREGDLLRDGRRGVVFFADVRRGSARTPRFDPWQVT